LNFATFSNDSLAILIFWFCPEIILLLLLLLLLLIIIIIIIQTEGNKLEATMAYSLNFRKEN